MKLRAVVSRTVNRLGPRAKCLICGGGLALCLATWTGLGVGLAIGVDFRIWTLLVTGAAVATEIFIWSLAAVLGMSIYQARHRIWRWLSHPFRHHSE